MVVLARHGNSNYGLQDLHKVEKMLKFTFYSQLLNMCATVIIVRMSLYVLFKGQHFAHCTFAIEQQAITLGRDTTDE